MYIKWTKKLKAKFGHSNAIDLYIKEEECLNRSCFSPHDWNHDRHLVCLTNSKYGCPRGDDER